MGKRTRKTRWRTLPIGDEQSDSEESNSTLDTRIPPTYHQKYYGRFTYSSQSTPTRRYQSDSTKSTRSSSTASENKITFNEDEYTRITTPRQDVLFKKGYLNKPKTYSTQTSTGNSTTSTGNSTGNGTPDYQSTDLDYESHFVFPNGFLDQNGIYYVNSYDPYPLMVYNAPTYYNNDICSRSKKYSTESLAETSSTTNEEHSQDAVNHDGGAQGEEMQHSPSPQTNGHPPTTEYGQVYNVVYPGFYYNGLCPPQDLANGQGHQAEPKRIKRRRRRKLSASKTHDQQQNGTTSEYTEEDSSSADEEEEESSQKGAPETNLPIENHATSIPPPSNVQTNESPTLEAHTPLPNDPSVNQNEPHVNSIDPVASDESNVDNEGCDNNRLQNGSSGTQSDSNDPSHLANTAENSLNLSDSYGAQKVKYDLKPDAQEFVPRTVHPETLQYFKIPPNFVPVPMINPLGAQNFNHAYLPTGIPVNFIPQSHPMYPGYMPGFVPPNFNAEQIPHSMNGAATEELQQDDVETRREVRRGDIDIKTVVSKLEDVANEPTKADGSFDRKDRNQHMSPNKKAGPYRHYDERKKFFSKNNKHNGYYQKRPYNKYQANGYNESPSHNTHYTEKIVHEVQEHPKINEELTNAVGNGAPHQDEDMLKIPIEVPRTEKLDEINACLEGRTSADPSETTNGVSSEEKNVLIEVQPSNTVQSQLGDVKGPQLNGAKMQNSPKFFPKQMKDTPDDIPKITVRDNANISTDVRRRWPRKDERSIQKRDQTLSYSEEKINQYKQNDSPSHKLNKRFNPNSPARRQNNQSNGYFNGNIVKYSETVKKIPQTFTTKSVERENTAKIPQQIKPATPEVKNTPTSNTQWISVSNKKKRRNRNTEDSEDSSEVAEEIGNKVDKFDQNNFLQNMILNGHSKIEEYNPLITQEPGQKLEVRNSPVKILEVRDLEKELLSNVGVEIMEEKKTLPVEDEIMEHIKPKAISKKKSKKNGQKQPTKRVIITDIDLSETVPESTIEEVIEEVPDENKIGEAEEVPSIEEATELEAVVAKVEVVPVADCEVVPMEVTEKKNKKKKKKQTKIAEVSTSMTKINNREDTYDILLENTFSNNSDDKTNMEISQELDLIIQRGMYSSLEEKIKSLNIIPIKEEFFQSVVRSSRESSMEKSPEFTKLLANSMPNFKYCMASVEDDPPKIPLTDIHQPSTSKNGLFVENSEVKELLKDIYGKEGSPEIEIGEIVKKTSPSRDVVIEIDEENSVERKTITRESSVVGDEPEKKKLYPITQAVKNWMTKTRENTPEVEILKSPSVIFKEFGEKSSDEENDVVNSIRSNSILESDEEVTVYSATRNSSDAVDLLDCWENEISNDSGRKSSIEDGCDDESKRNGCSNEDEDVLEVYESKYGRNEDFLELQKEIEEKKKQESDARSRNFPKHGALPYRAICCSIM